MVVDDVRGSHARLRRLLVFLPTNNDAFARFGDIIASRLDTTAVEPVRFLTHVVVDFVVRLCLAGGDVFALEGVVYDVLSAPGKRVGGVSEKRGTSSVTRTIRRTSISYRYGLCVSDIGSRLATVWWLDFQLSALCHG
ncbi:MAG: hypothetical protein J07HQW1_00992 [Haloquadratum walsbyi J07HQW1]|uniref:Uncharacterized protein n=1 Tax=Haloquadratum walsbyi J07HQW1 TaxID=1238424 RepID=U1PFR9_9EURY|nr:MAG: hypothetical protein J07HQW1_00992 [Haloquadratum walsbyi J07HQW1]